jgi:hypothetical protein
MSLPTLQSSGSAPVVLFDASKREAWSTGAGFKKLARRLKSTYEVRT